MKTQRLHRWMHTLAAAAFALALPLFSADAPHARQEAVVLSLTGKIQDVNLDKREITVKGPLGNVVTLGVDPRVKRLKEFKAGDEITADYLIAVAAEVREPTAEEKATPLVVLEEKAKAPAGTDPAVGGVRLFKVVTTVEGLDRTTQCVTVKGPLGHYVVAHAKHPEIIEKLRIGQPIVITYAEALALSLEKKAKRTE